MKIYLYMRIVLLTFLVFAHVRMAQLNTGSARTWYVIATVIVTAVLIEGIFRFYRKAFK